MLEMLETKSDPREMALSLGISEKAMLSLVYRLARNGSLRITEIRPGNKTTGGNDE